MTFRLVSAISRKWDQTTSWYLEITSSLVHPRRPRGSQPGREKRRDESFQVRVKEPLGIDSHRTISKNSSGCRSLIGHDKCFVLLVCTWRHGNHVGGQEQKHSSPLGTKLYFHVNSSRKYSFVLTPNMAALSRGCKPRIIVSNRPTVSPEFFSWVRTRRLLSCHTCPVRSPRLCTQGKLLFSTFLTRNEGTTDESKKSLGCHQQEQFNLPREYSVFDSSQ